MAEEKAKAEEKETAAGAPLPGLLGRKLGMTQFFTETGEVLPITVLEVGPCLIAQVKTVEKDGYAAVQLAFGDRKKKPNRPMAGHLNRSGAPLPYRLREVRLSEPAALKEGDELTVKLFEGVKRVDVRGTSKGRGFTGMVKRWNKAKGPESHGSMNIRAPGSIGMSATPARVLRGRRLPGHYGAENITARNLEVVRVDEKRHLLFVRGSVPGPNGGLVSVRRTKKQVRRVRIVPVKAKTEKRVRRRKR